MSERTSSFALFCLGAALFLAGYLSMAGMQPPFPLFYEALTVLFGLPYVARELWRRTNWLAVGYFLLVVPAFHRAAMEAAAWAFRNAPGVRGDSFPPPGAEILTGLAGGLVGGLSLLLLALPALRSSAPGWWRLAGLGLAALTLIGGLVIGFVGEFALIAIYPIWQVSYGWFLSRLIRPSPPRGAERPCDAEAFPP